MTINFYPRRKDRAAPLYLRYLHKGVQFKYATGVEATPESWDQKKNRFKPRGRIASQNNERLAYLEKVAQEVHAQLLGTGIPITKESISAAFKQRIEDDLLPFYQKIEREQNQFFFPYIAVFINNRERSGKYKPGTIETYRSVEKIVRGYQDYHGLELKFDDIDLNFFYSFLDFLESREYLQNYISKVIAILKLMLDEAAEDELHDNTKYKSKKFSVPREEVFNIYLDTEELLRIYNLDISVRGQKITRDYFLLEAFTSLRYSDVIRLGPENIEGRLLKITQQKGGKYTAVPANPIVTKIISENGGVFPKPPWNAEMNRHLKEIAKNAGIDDPVIKRKKKYKKYELVTTHTGRRSFITNCLNAGIPPPEVMRISGHSDYKDFMKYYKVSEEQIARSLINHPHFTMMKAVK